MAQPSIPPDPAKCERKHAFGDYWTCLVDPFCYFTLRFRFGGSYLCSYRNSQAEELPLDGSVRVLGER